MSTEKELTNEEVMKLIADYTNSVYQKGLTDGLIGVGIGVGIALVLTVSSFAFEEWKSKRALKKEIKEFNNIVKQEVES